MLINTDIPQQVGPSAATMHTIITSMLLQMGYILAGVSRHRWSSTRPNFQNIPRKETT